MRQQCSPLSTDCSWGDPAPVVSVDLALLIADGLGVGEDAAALLVPVSLQALVPHAQLLTWQPQIQLYAIRSTDPLNAAEFVNSLASTLK